MPRTPRDAAALLLRPVLGFGLHCCCCCCCFYHFSRHHRDYPSPLLSQRAVAAPPLRRAAPLLSKSPIRVAYPVAYPRRLSESPIRVAYPSRLSTSPIRVAYPSKISVSPIRVAYPSRLSGRLSGSPVRVAYPGRRRIAAGATRSSRISGVRHGNRAQAAAELSAARQPKVRWTGRPDSDKPAFPWLGC